jgi:molybdenum-dependent DNA-binding transcriptional regulator ModE
MASATDVLSFPDPRTLNQQVAIQPQSVDATPVRFMNLAGIDLVSIRLVVLCAECGSLSSAARLGNMSLSAASHRLTNLEIFFKTRLFDRDHRGLQITKAGSVFVMHAQAVLQTLHGLNKQLLSMAGQEPAGEAASVANFQIAGGLEKIRIPTYPRLRS